MNWLDNGEVLSSIGEFLAEDIGRGDITTQATVRPEARAQTGGLHSYNMDGSDHQVVSEGTRPNNVDVIYGFRLDGRPTSSMHSLSRYPSPPV